MKRGDLILGIVVMFFGTLISIGIYLSKDGNALRISPMIPFMLIGILGVFMFLFGYIPLWTYWRDRKAGG